MNIQSDSGYLLHVRPYRDTSIIGEFLLRNTGRTALVFKGVRQAGKSGAKGRLLQPFNPIFVSFDGTRDLKNGRTIEANGAAVQLKGKQIYCGLYLNELVLRMLLPQTPSEALFNAYEGSLKALISDALEPVLRNFEFSLLADFGYEIDFFKDAFGVDILPKYYYVYSLEEGFVSAVKVKTDTFGAVSVAKFLGSHILSIGRGCYADPATLKAAKQLSRIALAPHLGNKPLKSRELFL